MWLPRIGNSPFYGTSGESPQVTPKRTESQDLTGHGVQCGCIFDSTRLTVI